MSATIQPSQGAPAAGLSSLNTSTGAAVHRDLYKAPPDRAAEAAELRSQARSLGLAFLVFFGGIIGGISLSLNGLWAFDRAVNFGPDIEIGKLPGTPAEYTLSYSDGTSGPASFLDIARHDDTPTAEQTKGLLRLRILQEREDVATLFAPRRGEAKLTAVKWVGGGEFQEETVPACINAWRTAKLAHTVPTRYVMLVGLAMGVLGLIVPALLVPFYKGWMRFVAAPLGWFNTRLILSLVFFCMFTPVAVVLWLKRRMSPASDSLGREPKAADESYWHQMKKRDRKHFERLF